GENEINLYAFTRGQGVWRVSLGTIPEADPDQTCNYTITPTAQSFEASGAMGRSVRVTTQGTICTWSARSDVDWVKFTTTFPVTGNGEAKFDVEANTTDRARTTRLTIAGRDFNVFQAGAGGNCGATTISPGQTIGGSLTQNDCPTSRRGFSGI